MSMKDFSTMIGHLRRRFFGASPKAPPVNLRGKKIIVTGASPGSIGFETALTLAGWGACVIITTRSNANATADQLRRRLHQQGKSADIDSHVLDLADAGSVTHFAQWFQKKHGSQLDVLINNAGIHLDLAGHWKQPQLTPDGFEIHWRTNYLGTQHLTLLLLPLLKQAGRSTGNARIINVASHLHTKGTNAGLFAPIQPFHSWTAYGQSKLGLIHAAFEIQRRYASQGVQGFALHPGSIHTNISDKGLATRPLLRTLRNWFAPLEALVLLTPEQGAQTQILCATAAGLNGGIYYERCAPADCSEELDDLAAARRLWQETEVWVQNLQSEQGAGTRKDVIHV